MKFDQLLGNGQTQAGSAIFPLNRTVGLFKGAKNLLQPLFRNSDAGIDDADGQRFPRYLGRDLDGAGFGKLDGVAHQIVQNLLDAILIGLDQRRIRADAVDQLHRFLAHQRFGKQQHHLG